MGMKDSAGWQMPNGPTQSISKSSPDSADLHVAGILGGTLKKIRRPKYKQAMRRIS